MNFFVILTTRAGVSYFAVLDLGELNIWTFSMLPTSWVNRINGQSHQTQRENQLLWRLSHFFPLRTEYNFYETVVKRRLSMEETAAKSWDFDHPPSNWSVRTCPPLAVETNSDGCKKSTHRTVSVQFPLISAGKILMIDDHFSNPVPS